MRVHDRTCNQTYNEADNNGPKNVYHMNSSETFEFARITKPGL